MNTWPTSPRPATPSETAVARQATPVPEKDPGVLMAIVGDGQPLLLLTGLALVLSGGFALFLSAAGQFLPHDVQFLGLTAEQLARESDGRIVRFMFHDRVSFGGALVATGMLYLWLVEFPLRRGCEPWAWWTLAVSNAVGFASFFAYLGYGYRDQWHTAASVLMLPGFLLGMVRMRAKLPGSDAGWRCLLRPGAAGVPWRSPFGLSRLLLLGAAGGMLAGGGTILILGMTTVFVPEDLEFMCVTPEALRAVNANLIPLIAHDRAGFGGCLCAFGTALGLTVWCARPTRSLWETLAVAGAAGFGAAVGIHPLIGYNNPKHVLPAAAGALVYMAGLAGCWAEHPRGMKDKVCGEDAG